MSMETFQNDVTLEVMSNIDFESRDVFKTLPNIYDIPFVPKLN